jgi:tetratricopeptide (TPR) repeat protein
VRKSLLVVFGAIALFVGQARGQAYTARQANAYIAARDGQGALRYALTWTKAEPNNYFAWGALGAAYGIGLQQPANAIAAFQRALTIRPDAPECLNAMGIEYVNLKNYTEAQNVLKRAAEKAPTRANYWNDLAAAYSYQNKRSLALEALDNSQRLAGPGANYTDWYNMGNGFYEQQEYPKALFAFQQAVRLIRGTGTRGIIWARPSSGWETRARLCARTNRRERWAIRWEARTTRNCTMPLSPRSKPHKARGNRRRAWIELPRFITRNLLTITAGMIRTVCGAGRIKDFRSAIFPKIYCRRSRVSGSGFASKYSAKAFSKRWLSVSMCAKRVMEERNFRSSG